MNLIMLSLDFSNQIEYWHLKTPEKCKKLFPDLAVVTLIDNIKILLLGKIYKLRLEC